MNKKKKKPLNLIFIFFLCNFATDKFHKKNPTSSKIKDIRKSFLLSIMLLNNNLRYYYKI